MFGIFKRKRTEAIDDCARQMVQALAERFSPQDLEATPGKKTERKLERTLDSIYAIADDFHGREGLGVYGKARLGNTFKWELRELGYADAFIEEVTRQLVIRLGRG